MRFYRLLVLLVISLFIAFESMCNKEEEEKEEEEEEEELYSNAIGLSALEHMHTTRHAIQDMQLLKTADSF